MSIMEVAKGQIKSEWIYEIINFQKMNRKIDDFINPFWLNLTFNLDRLSNQSFQSYAIRLYV